MPIQDLKFVVNLAYINYLYYYINIFIRTKEMQFLNNAVNELLSEFVFPREKNLQEKNVSTSNKFLSNVEIESPSFNVIEDLKDLGVESENDDWHNNIIL